MWRPSARPGLSAFTNELIPKRIELLNEAVSGLERHRAIIVESTSSSDVLLMLPDLGLNHECALLLWRARIHVATAIEVIVDFRCCADHATIEEHIECRRLQVSFAQSA